MVRSRLRLIALLVLLLNPASLPAGVGKQVAVVAAFSVSSCSSRSPPVINGVAFFPNDEMRRKGRTSRRQQQLFLNFFYDEDEGRRRLTSRDSRRRRRRRRSTYSARFLQDNGLDIVATTARQPRASAAQDEESNASAAASAATSVTSASSASAKPSTSVAVVPPQTQSTHSTSATTAATTKSAATTTTSTPQPIAEHTAKVVPMTGFNVILTHATADFDSLASAVGLAKLWESSSSTSGAGAGGGGGSNSSVFDSASHVPTFVVLPRGAHPGVQRFLALHKHLFPIRSLKSLPTDLSNLHRLALVDAQRKDRLGPATFLLKHAKHITVVDHHIDQDSDIECIDDYVVDQVGSVTTIIAERLQQAQSQVELTEAEATLLALGIHADTGSLTFDSTTPRDAYALAWCLHMGASQAAIAEHAKSSLSREQQSILTQALMFANNTVAHGVSVSTVLLHADGFINGLAAVTQDALEMSSSDVFLLAVVYQAQSGGRRRRQHKQQQKEEDGSKHSTKKSNNNSISNNSDDTSSTGSNAKRKSAQLWMSSKLLDGGRATAATGTGSSHISSESYRVSWQGGEQALRRRKLRTSFVRIDQDASGTLDSREVAAALCQSGVIASPATIADLMEEMDGDGDGKIDFEEFVSFAERVGAATTTIIDNNTGAISSTSNQQANSSSSSPLSSATTMIVIGRARAGVNVKSVKLHKLLEKLGGGGHAKAASATVRLQTESEATVVLQNLVDELIATSLQKQPTVGDFMTSPVLSVKPHMTEKQVEDLLLRYDVRALPVVDDGNDVIGLVTYKEVAAAKQRLWNKEQKRLQRERSSAEGGGEPLHAVDASVQEQRKHHGTTVKAWMLQHVQLVEASKTMAQVESILLENDVGCMPVVADGTKQLVGMVTRTDLLRQHRYYPSLHYHNKGFADSIAARKPMIELRKRLKQFDIE